jgi:hypothetical protein
MATAEQQGVRWLAGALGGAGIALAAGVGLANVPNLDSYQPLAVTGVLVALTGIAACLWLVFQALRPADVTVAEAVSMTLTIPSKGGGPAEVDPSRPLEVLQAAETLNLRILDLPLTRFVNYEQWTDADQSINALDVRDPASVRREVRARGLANLPAVAAYITWQLPSAAALKDPLAERLVELKTALDQLQGYLELCRVRRQVRWARLALPLMAITTIIGVGLLLAATAQADDITASQTITGPVRVVAFLGSRDRSEAASTVDTGKRGAPSTTMAGPAGASPAAVSSCALPPGQSLDAVAIGGTWKEPSLLLRGQGASCPVMQIEADRDTAIIPAAPITTAIPVQAWLGATHRAELVRLRPKAVGACAAATGPVEASAVGGTWTDPQLIIHEIPGTQRGGPLYACAAVRLRSIDPETTIHPKSGPVRP